MNHQSESPVWFKHLSTKRPGRVYYYNIQTCEAMWEKPEGVKIVDMTGERASNQSKENSTQNSSDESYGEFVKGLCCPKSNSTLPVGNGIGQIHETKVQGSNTSSSTRSKSESYKKNNSTKEFSNGSPTGYIITNNKDNEQAGHHQTKYTEIKPRPRTSSIAQKRPCLQTASQETASKNPNDQSIQCKRARIDISDPVSSKVIQHVSKTPIQDRFNRAKEQLLKKQNQSNVIKGQKITCETSSLPLTSSISICNKRSKTFDLRMKLQQRRDSTQTHPATVTSNSNEMEWEDESPVLQGISTTSCITNEVKESSLTAPVQKSLVFPEYKRVHLVCDTNALLDDHVFVEKLICDGSFLGLPVKVVIPFIVFGELDNIKVRESIGHIARKISRIIKSNIKQQNYHLFLQDGNKSREPVGSLELNVNDDMILNCCLQTREMCGEGELAILMTNDNNLANKASSFKLNTYNWVAFRRWAKGSKEQNCSFLFTNGIQKNHGPLPQLENNNTSEDERMDLDNSVHESDTKNHLLTELHNNDCEDKDLSDSGSQSTQLQSTINRHLFELKFDFETLLHDVLKEAMETEYGKLKCYSNNIKPSWTLLNYISETRKRWSLITSSFPSKEVTDILSHLVAAFKKYNSGKENFTADDVNNVFFLCNSLSGMFLEKYPTPTKVFLHKLRELKEEFTDAQSSFSLVSDSQNRLSEDDTLLQPVDLALQTIHTCLNSKFEDLKKKSEQKHDIEEPLAILYEKISKLLRAVKSVQENHECLTSSNEKIHQLYNLITKLLKGITFPFDDLIEENVVEFFDDTFYRKNVEQNLNSLLKLQANVDKLLSSIEGLPLV